MRDVDGVPVRDTLDELVDPAVTALLVVDVQNDFCHPDGLFAKAGKDVAMMREALPRIRRTVTEAQSLGIRTVFIKQTTLPDGRSDSPAWLRFKTRDGKSPGYTLSGSWGWEVDEGLTVRPQDWVVEKYRPDAFVYTSLDQMLRVNGIESVVVLGFVTEGCVESTVRGASYHDYYTLVVRDCVASPSAVLHAGSMRLFEARYPIVTSADLLATWRRASATARAAHG